jgi:hypothetical protein
VPAAAAAPPAIALFFRNERLETLFWLSLFIIILPDDVCCLGQPNALSIQEHLPNGNSTSLRPVGIVATIAFQSQKIHHSSPLSPVSSHFGEKAGPAVTS